MRIDDCKMVIWNLMEQVRYSVYSRNPAFSALRLVFLKYAVDNCIGATSKEDMQQCVRAHKMLAMRDIENGIDTMISVLRYIDRFYGFDHILSHPSNIDAYARELFGVDQNRQKKNASEENFKTIMSLLGELDLEDRNDESIGATYADALLEIIETNSERNSFSAEFVTNHSISKLAKAILNVNDTDIFVDFTSGTGASTLDIIGGARPQILNAEINGEAVAVSAMLYIMKGHEKLRIVCQDSLGNAVADLCGNKLFVDAPLSMKVAKTNDNEYTDSSLAVINRVMHDYLTRDGIAVITLPSSPLYQMRPQAISLRDEMVSLGLLKAVIALPPLWNNTAVNTNLLVLSKKEMPCHSVVFIDAVGESKKISNRNRANTLDEGLITRIVSAIENQESIDGFSCVTRTGEICNKDFNLAPANYIKYPKAEESITIDEIETQLSELYRQLLQ